MGMSTLEQSTKWMSTGYYTERQQANEQVVVTAPTFPVLRFGCLAVSAVVAAVPRRRLQLFLPCACSSQAAANDRRARGRHPHHRRFPRAVTIAALERG